MIAGNGGAGDHIGGDSRRGKVLTGGKREATLPLGGQTVLENVIGNVRKSEVREIVFGARLCGGRDSREGTAPWVKVVINRDRLRRHCR